MNIKITLHEDMFERAVLFGEQPGITFNAHAENLFDSLESVLGEIRAAGSDQVLGRGGFRAGSSDRTTIAEDLRVTLKDMEKMAESFDPTQFPMAALQFQVPRSRNHQVVRATADAFVQATEPVAIQQAFVARGFAADFRAQLQAAIAGIDLAADRKNGGLQSQVGGTSDMKAKIRVGMQIVSELDAIITKQLRKTDPARLFVWKRASRLAIGPRDDAPAAAVVKPAASAPVLPAA